MEKDAGVAFLGASEPVNCHAFYGDGEDENWNDGPLNNGKDHETGQDEDNIAEDAKGKEGDEGEKDAAQTSAASKIEEFAAQTSAASKIEEVDESPSAFEGLTDDMLKEKRATERQLAEEEEERKKVFLAASSAYVEPDYNKLQVLLEKSTIYTDYLLKRMHARQEKLKKKAEKRMKNAANQPDTHQTAQRGRSKGEKDKRGKDGREEKENQHPQSRDDMTSGWELGHLVAVFVTSSDDAIDSPSPKATTSKSAATGKNLRRPSLQPAWWPAVVCKDPETSVVSKIVQGSSIADDAAPVADDISNATFLRFFHKQPPTFVDDSRIQLVEEGLRLQREDTKRWSLWEKNNLNWSEAVRLARSCVNSPLREKMKLVGDDTFSVGRIKKQLKQSVQDAAKEADELAAGRDEIGVMEGRQRDHDAPATLLAVIENVDAILADPDLDQFSRRVKGEPISDLQPQLFTGGVLRDYQVKGFAWLKSLFDNGINGILADEMGLGKTIQVIALIADLISKKCQGPYIVVAPFSTIPNWFKEFKRFTPAIPVMVHHGLKVPRLEGSRKIKNRYCVGPWVSSPVVITSYEMTIYDRKVIGGYPWKCLVVDEGHRIKNMNCRLVRELKLFNASNRLLLTGTPLQNNLTELWSLLNFLLPEIFDDLQSFHSWFDMSLIYEAGKQAPSSAAAVAAAEKRIIKAEQENKVLTVLHKILEPFLLRRLKTDVRMDIPPKREVLVYAPMTPTQEEFYKSSADKTILAMLVDKVIPCPELVQEGDDANGRGRLRRRNRVDYALLAGENPVRKVLKEGEGGKKTKIYADESSDEEGSEEGGDADDEQRGRKSGNDDDDDDEWLSQIAQITNDRERNLTELKGTGTKTSLRRLKLQNIMMLLRRVCNHPFMIEYPMDEMNAPTVNIVNLCGKRMIMDQMLFSLKKSGHKVLIFSQSTQMMDIIADYLEFRGYSHSRLDGSMGMDDRQQHIEAFNEDPDRFVFLLSTRAGGLGLNLMAADTVIIYDSDWNPQCDLQAQDRAHRIGQTRPVMVYRLVTGNTIDQRIVERAAAKRKLEKMVIKKGRFQQPTASKGSTDNMLGMSPKELLALLATRDQDMVMRTTETSVTSEGIHWTLTEDQLEKLLDRSELYEKWECDRRRRKLAEAGVEGVEEEIVMEEEKTGEAAEGEDPKMNRVFTVVETTVGVSSDDLV